MLANFVRKMLIASLVTIILGGLWLLASWKSDLDGGAIPNPLWSKPVFQRLVQVFIPDLHTSTVVPSNIRPAALTDFYARTDANPASRIAAS